MKIVIDIPEEEYNTGQLLQYFGCYSNKLDSVIYNGTPLPKGHGRLGDLDALEEYFRNVRKELKASDYKNGTEFFVRDEMLLNVQQFIHLCDAIIEGSDSE